MQESIGPFRPREQVDEWIGNPHAEGMKMCSLPVLAGLLLLVCTPDRLQAEVREWTRAADGKKISAEFVGMKDESTIQIKMSNGQLFEVPLASLSEGDREFVKGLTMAKEGGDKPSTSSPPKVPEGEVTVTLSGVHLCCGDCVDAVVAAKEHDKVAVDPAVEISASRSDGTVTIKAPSGKAAQTALRAILSSGFYGKSDNEAVKIPDLKEDDFTSDTMSVRDVHLCCRGCVRDFNDAVESVEGVKDFEAKAGSSRVTIKGEGFKPYEVMAALREAGFGDSFQ